MRLSLNLGVGSAIGRTNPGPYPPPGYLAWLHTDGTNGASATVPNKKTAGTTVYYLAQALGHDNADDYAEIGGTASTFEPGTNDLTIAWTGEVLESTGTADTLVGKADLNAAGGWALMQDGGEIKLWMYDANDPGKYRWVKPTTPITAGIHDIRFEKSGTNVDLYVDDVEITSLTEGGDASGIPANIEASGVTLLIGAGRHTGTITYHVANTMLYLKVESGSDVFETHFSEGAGTTLYCVAGSGLTATLHQTRAVAERWDSFLKGPAWNIEKGFELSGGVQIPSLANGSGPVGGGSFTNDGGFLHNQSSDKLYVDEQKTYSSTVATFDADGYPLWEGDYTKVTGILWEDGNDFTFSYEYNAVEEEDLWQGFDDAEPANLVWIDIYSNGTPDPTGNYEHEITSDPGTMVFKQLPYTYPEWDGPDGRTYTYLAANNGNADYLRTVYDGDNNMIELLWYNPAPTGGPLTQLNNYLAHVERT